MPVKETSHTMKENDEHNGISHFQEFYYSLKKHDKFFKTVLHIFKNKINKTFIQFFLEAKFLSYGILSNMQEINI